MTRVAIICGAGIVSGKEIMVLELAAGLRERGGAVDLITSRWGNGEFARRAQAADFPLRWMWLGFISATLNLECLRMTVHQLIHWPELVFQYRRFLRETKPEKVIHTNWHHLLLLWPFLKSGRDLFWLHEVVPGTSQYRCVFQFLQRRLGCLVAVSQAVAASLEAIGIASSKIRVIHNGLTAPCLAGVPAAPGNNPLRIGIVGQVGVWKGHGDLFDAFAEVVKSNPESELHIFGRRGGDYEVQLKQKAESAGIARQIVWRGFIADQREVYSGLDVCVVPSRSPDPLPTVAIEAAFFGVPVVATRRGGLPEIVEEGVTGFLVEAENPAQLAARLGELLRDSELRKKMGQAARQRAETHFSQARFVEDFLRLLRKPSPAETVAR